MDPVSTLGVAAAVVQFVDYAAELIGTGYEIYKSVEGATEENLHVEFLVSHTKELTRRLATSSQLVRASGTDEAKIEELARRCQDLAEELLDCLQSLKVDSTFRSWAVVRQAVRAKWNDSKIDTLQRRINGVKSEISLQLLCMISNEQSAVGVLVKDIDARCKAMQLQRDSELDKLRDDIRVDLSAQSRQLSVLVDGLNQIRNSPPEPKLRKELKQRLLNELASPGDIPGTPDEDIDYATLLTTAADACQSSLSAPIPRLRHFLAESDAQAKQLRILNSLQYQEMMSRHFDVGKAYPTTYSWIFEDNASPFALWLRSSSGVFWISGKPGAGKSTMMKFLSEHPKTEELLDVWSSGDTLIISRHFFWATGTHMQSSLQGLLQSLLFQILRQQPQLIADVCHARWQADTVSQHLPAIWTQAELECSLDEALSQRHGRTKFCFFLDGLDEYAEDQFELIADVIERYAKSTRVKFCVSSRPHNVFETAFGSKPQRKLILQDLTTSDMDHFIQGKLERDRRFKALSAQDPQAAVFAQQIRQKASGVFLWVHLVVNELLLGLNEDDDIPTLQRRLDVLPEDMIKLYEHIVAQIAPVYRTCAARSLLLANESSEPLPFLTYWLLYQDVLQQTALANVKTEPISRDEIKAKRQDVSKKLSSWCKGLLEVVRVARDANWNAWEPLREYVVGFHHKTVKDFLQTSGMQAFLRERAGADFNPQQTLCHLFVAQSKLVNVQNGLEDEMRAFFFMASHAKHYAKLCDQRRDDPTQACSKATSEQLRQVEHQLRASTASLKRSGALQAPAAMNRSRSRSSEGSKRSGFMPLLRKLIDG